MTLANSLSIDLLRRLISYEPDTGVLRWLPRQPSDFHCSAKSLARVCNSWNAKYSGMQIVSAMSNGRIVVHINVGTRMRTQGARVAWALHHGAWPSAVIDHIDGNCQNDRISNLRDVTTSQNIRNQRISTRNTSGKVGVTFFQRTQRWRAWISLNGQVKSLGYFLTFEAAVAARIAAENEHGFYEATRASECLKYGGARR